MPGAEEEMDEAVEAIPTAVVVEKEVLPFGTKAHSSMWTLINSLINRILRTGRMGKIICQRVPLATSSIRCRTETTRIIKMSMETMLWAIILCCSSPRWFRHNKPPIMYNLRQRPQRWESYSRDHRAMVEA